MDCSRDVFKNLHQLSHWCPIAPSSAKKWKGPPPSPTWAPSLPPKSCVWVCVGGVCLGARGAALL